MSTVPDPNVMDTCKACDDLTVIRDKLHGLEAAARGVESPVEAEGLSWIIQDLRDEVVGVLELIGEVNTRLRDSGAVDDFLDDLGDEGGGA